jgi:hypothetical protein
LIVLGCIGGVRWRDRWQWLSRIQSLQLHSRLERARASIVASSALEKRAEAQVAQAEALLNTPITASEKTSRSTPFR